MIIGLVGQICAGKSTVSKIFKESGAEIYDADAQVHELYKDPDVIRQVATAFPTVLLRPMGAASQIDRKILADIVFADEARLRVLLDIVSPHLSAAMTRVCQEHRNKNKDRILLIDAPTLFEAGHESLCDRLVFVAAPIQRRIEWAKKRHWDEKEIAKREAMLIPEAKKRAVCDVIIQNDGTEEHLKIAVRRLIS